MMAYRSVDEIERLVVRFADCSLPCAEWTHGAHLTVGLWHAWRYPANEALDFVCHHIYQPPTSYDDVVKSGATEEIYVPDENIELERVGFRRESIHSILKGKAHEKN